MHSSFRKHGATPALTDGLGKKVGVGTPERSSLNGRFVPASAVKPNLRETKTELVKPTKKTK